MLAIPSPRSAAHIALVKMVVASSWSNVEWTTVLNVPAAEFCDPPCWRHAYAPACCNPPHRGLVSLMPMHVPADREQPFHILFSHPVVSLLSLMDGHQLRYRHRKHCGYPFWSELLSPELDAFSATLTSIDDGARCGFPGSQMALGRGFRTFHSKRSDQAPKVPDSDPAT